MKENVFLNYNDTGDNYRCLIKCKVVCHW